jgi:hypothetical protein
MIYDQDLAVMLLGKFYPRTFNSLRAGAVSGLTLPAHRLAT